jgi:hypothetical protein
MGAIGVDPVPDAIAAGLLKLLSHEARRVGETAAELIGTELAWKTVAAAWLQQVTSLLADAR